MTTRTTYNTAYTGNDAIPVFISFCVEQYAHEKGLTAPEAMLAFDRNGIPDGLSKRYEGFQKEIKEKLAEKKECLRPEQLYLILPYKVSQLAMMYAKKFGVSILEALKTIYASKTYSDLSREETKLWHYGPVALFEYYMENH